MFLPFFRKRPVFFAGWTYQAILYSIRKKKLIMEMREFFKCCDNRFSNTFARFFVTIDEFEKMLMYFILFTFFIV